MLVDGELVVYLERGGKSLLAWGSDDGILTEAVAALGRDGHRVGMDRSVVTRVNGVAPVERHALALTAAGFLPTPRGYRSPRG